MSRLLTGGGRWRPLLGVLFGAAAVLLLISAGVVLAGTWNESAAPQAAAPSAPSGQGDGEDEPLETGPALAGVSAGGLHDGLAGLLAFREAAPAETPTCAWKPTSTPTPKPAATQRPALPQPTASPQPVAAPPTVPPAPPAPPPTAPPAAPPAAPPDPTATPQPPPPIPSCPTAAMSGLGLDLFNAMSSERTQHGLPALAANGCVVYVAQIRSDDMASRGYFSHTSPEGETAFSLMDQYGVRYGWAGENLARNNYPDDESVGVSIRDLMASEGHRENILRGAFTQAGVAVAFDGEGMKYFTMIFIGPP